MPPQTLHTIGITKTEFTGIPEPGVIKPGHAIKFELRDRTEQAMLSWEVKSTEFFEGLTP